MGRLFGATKPPASAEPESRGMSMPPIYWQAAAGPGQYAVDASGDVSLQSIAVRSSIDLICSLMSELPVHVYNGDGKQIRTPGNLDDPGSDGYGLADWLYQLGQSWLTRGNAYGDIVGTNTRGRPTHVSWWHPDEVRPQMVDGAVVWHVNGRRVDKPIVHRRVNPVPNRVLGLSPIQQHATQIGTSISAGRFGQDWFADGAHPSALLTNSEGITEAEAETAKARWMAKFRGNREPAVLGKGWDYKPVQVSADESQFLATMGFSEAQCARIFGAGIAETLGYESGGSMTYANVVDRRSDLLVFTLGRWLRRADRVLTELLPSPQKAELDRDAMLQSTTLARYQAHSIALDKGFRTVNEVREDENYPPVAWGDEPLKQPSGSQSTATQPGGG